MINGKFSLLIVMLLVTISPAVDAAESSGQMLPEQLQQIESLQRRSDKLAFGELGPNDYHLAKARVWLDLARSEYFEREGTAILPGAIEQAETLLDALEKKYPVITMDTPNQLPGSEAVRPDLWNKIDKLKQHDKFFCGQRPIAEAEVHLVWAGHEKLESSWSHAESYARNAEDLLDEAKHLINGCVAKISATEKINLSSDVLFGFNEAVMEPSELWRINRLVDTIKMTKTLEGVVLVGHTDRLRSDGHPERNQLLSEQRARNIKKYLVAKGIPGESIHASGVGSSQPVVQCPTNTSKAKQILCLQPNRRVEITLRGTK
jgi:outer membrane protein OmpA-like peptidoglycan-associated protein